MSGVVQVRLKFSPFEHQKAAHALRLTARFLVLVWHRRAGKTVFAVMELILAALACKRERGRFGYVAPFLKQAKSVAWDYLKALTADIPGASYNETELAVDLPNGARIRIFGADNPESFRGLYFDGIVMDEVADMKPQVWGKIIRPALADRQGWALFIGTPKGVNLFSELYYKALEGLEGWAADLRRASDTGVIPAAEIEQARQSMSGPEFAQEFDCDFAAASENVLVMLDTVLESQKRQISPSDYRDSPKVLGVDVARYGGDRSVIFPRQGIAAFRPKLFRGLDLMDLSSQVALSIDKWQPDAVFVDQGGMGAGVLDRLRQLGYVAIGVDFGGRALDQRFENKVAEMWWSMADWIKVGRLPSEPQDLAGELTARMYSYKNKRGRLALESKDELRKRSLPSPDVADALALTFAAPVAKRGPHLPGAGNRNTATHEYDPYADRSAA